MDALTFRLLSHLKRAFEDACSVVRYECESTGLEAGARQFYTLELSDNLVRPMAERHRKEYAQGSGGELEDKMRALRSSSAMAFNVLGNETFTVRGPHAHRNDTLEPGCYRVTYEVQLPTLRRGIPANLDALLENGHRTVACEMKFLEWVSAHPRPLKDAYHRREAYRHDRAADVFVPIALQLEKHGFARYDYAQMFKHALALFNACAEEKLTVAGNLELLNVIWEPPQHSTTLTDDDLHSLDHASKQERREFEWFAKDMQPVVELFERLGIHFSIAYLPVADLIALGDYAHEEQRKLQRYTN